MALVTPKAELIHTLKPRLLRGAVIGAGFFAAIQMDAWQRSAGVSIVAVCDRDASRAEAFAQRFDVPHIYHDATTLFASERLDFVDIVTRPESHLELVQLAARHGVAVLCQKPLTTSFDEAQELVRLVTRSKLPFMVNENWRWQVWYREMKDLLRQGTIGEVFHSRLIMRPGDGRGNAPYAEQPYFRQYSRLLIFETGVHYIDTLRFLLGEVRTVYAVTRQINPVIAGEDLALAVFEFDSGATALFDANRYSAREGSHEAFGLVQLEGREGVIRLNADLTLSVIRYDTGHYHHHYHNPGGYRGGSCLGAQTHFAHALRHKEPFETGGLDYLRTLAVVEAVYQSAAHGERVSPQYPVVAV
jgi:D-apiose dehydrogenase